MINRLTNDDVKYIICVGATGKFIATQLIKQGYDSQRLTCKDDYNEWTMQEIVEVAKSKSSEGDNVLMSTGSASFGIFKDYKERGNQFISTVQDL